MRSTDQWWVVTRLAHGDAMTFLVWRDGRYQQIQTNVPERWLEVQLGEYRGTSRRP